MRWRFWSKDDEVERSRREAEALHREAKLRAPEIEDAAARLKAHLAHNHIAERITRAMGGES